MIPKGYHNLPAGQISHCVSNISHFRQEIYHFPVRENIIGSYENPFSQLPFGRLFLYVRNNKYGNASVPLRPKGNRRERCPQRSAR